MYCSYRCYLFTQACIGCMKDIWIGLFDCMPLVLAVCVRHGIMYTLYGRYFCGLLALTSNIARIVNPPTL